MTKGIPSETLREALERLLAVAMTEEEDVSAATQDEWIAAFAQANEALATPSGGIPLIPGDGFDNTTEACRHCPTPEVHPTRVGGMLTYEGRCDPETCERHDHSEGAG